MKPRPGMALLKVCSCERIHSRIPETATQLDSGDDFAGLYWTCACGSTLFVPFNCVPADTYYDDSDDDGMEREAQEREDEERAKDDDFGSDYTLRGYR